MNNFSKTFEGSLSNIRTLPLFHACDARSFKEILESESLKAMNCRVFKEKLCYFFYGRPSYRVNPHETIKGSRELFPVVLVFDSDKITSNDNIYKIFPFDTGAFSAGYYKNFIPEKTSIDNYEMLPTQVESIKKFIYFLYKENINYLNSKIDNTSVNPLDFEMQNISKMSTGADNNLELDERAYTIEMTIKNDININVGNLIGLIMPKDFLDSDNSKISEFAMEDSIQCMTYNTFTITPSDYTGLILQWSKEYVEHIINSSKNGENNAE